MNSKVRIILLFFHLFVFILSAYSQEPWTLEKCITYAFENNIQIKQQKLNTEYNSNLLSRSRADIYPGLSANSSYGASFGRALDQTTYEFTQNQTVQSINIGLSASATIFNGFTKMNTIKKTDFDLRASLQDLERLKNEISLNIAAAYLQILFNRELLEIARNQFGITSQQVERTRILVDAGSVAHGNLLEIQAQQASEELQVVNYENLLSLSHLSLAQILDLDSVQGFSIVIPDISDIDESELLLSVNDVYSSAETIRPEVEGSRLRHESAKKSLDIAKGYRYPSLRITGNYGTGYSDIRQQVTGVNDVTRILGYTPGNEPVTIVYPEPVYGAYPLSNQFKDNASSSIFLNLSVPIFSNFQISTGISNSRINMENYRLELENVKNILYKNIQQAYTDAVAALKKYKASEKALAATQESFNYTREKFAVGLVNTVDYNLAQTQLFRTQSDLLQAKYDYIFKTNILNFYMGKPIKL